MTSKKPLCYFEVTFPYNAGDCRLHVNFNFSSTRLVCISPCFHKLIHFCILPENVLKAYLCEKGVLIEISYNLVVHTVKTLQPAIPNSQITPLRHFIGLRYIHLSENVILKIVAWLLDYTECLLV